MDPIAPGAIRYIKLGAGGAFARSSLDNGELQLGYHEVPHDVCVAGDWDGILARFQDTSTAAIALGRWAITTTMPPRFRTP